MFVSVWHVVIALVVVLFTFLLTRSYRLKNKLKWVGVAPAWPLIGNACDFMDSTKSLNAMHNYILKHNGMCFIELLFRPLILISDYKFLEWLLSSNTIIQKSKDYQTLRSWLEEGILITHGLTWKKGRKILTPAFHFNVLEQFVDVFERPASTLVNILDREVGKESVDIYPFITKYGLDVICETAMGVQMNVQEDSNSNYVNAVAEMCRIVVERAFHPLKMIDTFYYLSIDHLREKRYVKLLHAVSNAVIEKRKEELEKKNKAKDKTGDSNERNGDQEESDTGVKQRMAFLDLMFTLKDENNQPLSNKFIREQVDTFMFAGHDTTSSANSFALYCLANHPDVQEKALQEIKDVLGDRDKLTFRDLQNLKYLELVIKETLRLYPSVPIYSRVTTEDTVYDGDKIIPAGVTLIVVCYTINRNPNVYEEPDKFIPTRFSGTENKPFSYLPFSAGPRNCIGQKFAMLNMKHTLATMLLNFELLPAIPEHKVILAAETVLKSKNGIKIRLKKRDLSQ